MNFDVLYLIVMSNIVLIYFIIREDFKWNIGMINDYMGDNKIPFLRDLQLLSWSLNFVMIIKE